MRCLTAVLVVLAHGLLAAQSGPSVSVGARALQPGEVVALTIRTTAPAERVGVRILDRDVIAFRTDGMTWLALVGIDLETRPGQYLAEVEAHHGEATSRSRTVLTVQPKRFTTRRLRVDADFVNPPEAVNARILDEADRLTRLWTLATDRHWSGPFVAPVASRPVGRFGARSVFNGQPRAPHGGDDYPGPVGTPVVAPAGGTVVLAEDLYFTGKTLVLDHGLGLLSLFAHLSAFRAAKGDAVTVGQEIGLMGATGRVTGPHLHWAVRLGGARVDPASLLAALGPRATTETRPARR